MAVSCQQRLFLHGSYDRVDQHAQALQERKWRKLSCGQGAKGERWYAWAFVPFGVPTEKRLHRGLLIRRSLKHPEKRAYYFTHAPQGTPLAKIVRVAGSRWAIEECFEHAKQETGLAHYEVRGWTGWYRHITLATFAQAFLSVVRAQANPPVRRKKRRVALI